MKRMAWLLALLPLAFAISPASAAQTIDHKEAAQYFAEAHRICQQDAGRLWGVSLDSPMLFVDPATHEAVANQADKDGQLTPQDGVFVGTLPASEPIANYTLKWAGTDWTMVMWPLPKDRALRDKLMMHESFHNVVQGRLGIPFASATNAHLDSLDGRIFQQLEWRALLRALETKDAPRRQALSDALAFRAFRQSLFKTARQEEANLETGEGLAEYTGVRLCGLSEKGVAQLLQAKLDQDASSPSFTRSFAYTTGPLYGLLLDQLNPSWRQHVKAGVSLADLLPRAYAHVPTGDRQADFERQLKAYDGLALMAQEKERSRKRDALIAAYTAKLLKGPVLRLPASEGSSSFNPFDVLTLGEGQTIYRKYWFSSDWGVLTVTDGVLSTQLNGERMLFVQAPTSHTVPELSGPGWKLQLKPGWKLVAGKRPGDLVVTR